MFHIIYLLGLTLFLLLYFKLAVRFKIIDKPNHRSSHRKLTIRGGGIIFPIALLIFFFFSGLEYPLFTAGLALISLVSFYDDLSPLSNKIRLCVHVFSVSLLFMEVGLIDQPIWIICLVYFLVIGTINAYNFMDGINGITGSYSLITLGSLYAINDINSFVSSEWLMVSILALLVFNFFNFRKVAKCFAGDVGSISMAFIIIFFLLLLISKTHELKYIGLLLLYGVDTVTTIAFRVIRGENVFKAHRSHFYQYLVNVKGWQHLAVSILYTVVQLFINLLIIFNDYRWSQFLMFVIISGIVFIGLRFIVEGKTYLTQSHTSDAI